jgi:hypothetical protein
VRRDEQPPVTPAPSDPPGVHPEVSMSVLITTRTALARLSAALHTRLTPADIAADAGMTTAEYAVGTVAACGFAGVLYKLITSDLVMSLLKALISKASTCPSDQLPGRCRRAGPGVEAWRPRCSTTPRRDASETAASPPPRLPPRCPR